MEFYSWLSFMATMSPTMASMATTYFQSLVVLYISLIHGDFSCKKVHILALFTPFGCARSYISCVFRWRLFNWHLGYPISTSMVPYCFHRYISKGDTFNSHFLEVFWHKIQPLICLFTHVFMAHSYHSYSPLTVALLPSYAVYYVLQFLAALFGVFNGVILSHTLAIF